mgnify:CR=1 FL=1
MSKGTAIRLYLGPLLLFVVALLQVTIMPHLTIVHLQPDLALAAVVGWALYSGPSQGALSGSIVGLALDMLSGGPFGMHTCVMSIVGTLAGLGAALLPREHVLLLPAVAVLCTFVQQGAYVWLLRTAGWPLDWGQVLIAIVIPMALINLFLTVLFYPFVGLLYRRTAPKELGW